MLREYSEVIPLVDNPRGWTANQVHIYYNPVPTFTDDQLLALEAARQRTVEQRVSFGDFNAPKAAVRRLSVQEDTLNVDTYLTEYFVLWGLPGAVSDLHRQALNDLHQKKGNRNTYGYLYS